MFATYPGLEFVGHRHLFRTTYFAVKWVRDATVHGSCPLIVHLPCGDVGANELAEDERLLQLGFKKVPYPPLPAEAAVLLGPDWDNGLPRVVKFGHGDLRVSTQHTSGQLSSVWIWIVEPGHETVAWKAAATRCAISIDGKRLTLPLPEPEMVSVLGAPEGRRKDY